MHLDRLKKSLFIGVACLSLFTFFIAACGSTGSSNTGGATTAAATATCPPNRFKTASGTLQSITGTSLLVHSTQGSNVEASYATTTRFQREAAATTSALKEGTAVTIAVTQDSNGNYIATSITLVANRGAAGGAGGFGGFGGRNGTPGAFGGRNGTPGASGGRNASCFRQGGGNFGGANGAPGAGGTSNGRGLTGTVGQLSGSSLTITDFQGSNYVVTLNASTKIIQFQSATASALKNGANITLTGAADSKGVITAQSITILLSSSTPSTTT